MLRMHRTRSPRPSLLLAAAAALALVLAACTSNSGASSAASTAASAGASSGGGGGTVVKLSGFKFDPASLTISVGTKVTFENDDGTEHTVTNGKDGTPESSPAFDMPVGSGASVDFTFTKAGTYNVTCKIHHSMNMTITVQ